MTLIRRHIRACPTPVSRSPKRHCTALVTDTLTTELMSVNGFPKRQADFPSSQARYRLLKVGSEPSPPGLVNLAQPFLGFQCGLSQRLIRIRYGGYCQASTGGRRPGARGSAPSARAPPRRTGPWRRGSADGSGSPPGGSTETALPLAGLFLLA
jgi:hypothetical protein